MCPVTALRTKITRVQRRPQASLQVCVGHSYTGWEDAVSLAWEEAKTPRNSLRSPPPPGGGPLSGVWGEGHWVLTVCQDSPNTTRCIGLSGVRG